MKQHPTAINSETDRAAWTEFVYRLVEHYKWEPQHLTGSISEFDARIRRQEVPLNFLFNILLRIVGSETIITILKQFGLGGNDLAHGRFHLRDPWAPNFTQPDVRIESDSARIFIEIKVGAKSSVEQVQKYLLLHAQLDIEDRKKQPYLLFLTEREFKKCWQPPREALVSDDIQTFLYEMTICHTVQDRLVKMVRDKNVLAQYEVVKREIKYHSAMWSSIGECLMAVCSRWRDTDSPNIELCVVDDFVRDLKRRRLMI